MINTTKSRINNLTTPMEGNNDRKRQPNQDDWSDDQIPSSLSSPLKQRSLSPTNLLNQSYKNVTIKGELWTRLIRVDEIDNDDV